MTVSWSYPTRIIFGVGAVRQTGNVLAERGVKRALVVTDPGVVKAGLIEPVTASLDKAQIAGVLFDGVAGNPLEEHVEAGHAAYAAAGAQAVVAVGGGSAMDVAKVVAMRVNHRRPLGDYDEYKGGDKLVNGEVPPIVAIPTTAGTGSEVGRAGVVTLRETNRKTVIFAPKLLPCAAILDPELTASMPAHITAATGYDALTHCVEALVATHDHPLSAAIAVGGIKLVAKSLERAVRDGSDLEARGDMLKAAAMGAIAFQKGLGACHSLAHPLSSVCGLHHGLANALCLPEVVRFNLDHAADDYAEVARIFTGKSHAAAAVDALAELRARVRIQAGLANHGVTAEHLDELADEAIADGCHTFNPRKCSRDDLRGLYERCM